MDNDEWKKEGGLVAFDTWIKETTTFTPDALPEYSVL